MSSYGSAECGGAGFWNDVAYAHLRELTWELQDLRAAVECLRSQTGCTEQFRDSTFDISGFVYDYKRNEYIAASDAGEGVRDAVHPGSLKWLPPPEHAGQSAASKALAEDLELELEQLAAPPEPGPKIVLTRSSDLF